MLEKLKTLIAKVKAWFTGEKVIMAPKVTALEAEVKAFAAKTAPQVEAEAKSI
jgi:hypothetical protein